MLAYDYSILSAVISSVLATIGRSPGANTRFAKLHQRANGSDSVTVWLFQNVLVAWTFQRKSGVRYILNGTAPNYRKLLQKSRMCCCALNSVKHSGRSKTAGPSPNGNCVTFGPTPSVIVMALGNACIAGSSYNGTSNL